MTEFNSVEEPLDLIRLSLDERILVKCKLQRELKGKLIAYDPHLNLLLGDAEERITSIEVDMVTNQEVTKVKKRNMPLVFVRGDLVVLISPPSKTVG